MAENECSLVFEVKIEGSMLSIYVSRVPVSCKFFIDCFLTGFPETLQTFGMRVPSFSSIDENKCSLFFAVQIEGSLV